MSDNIEVVNPQGPGHTTSPNYTEKTSTANGDQKANEQSARCSNGGCGTEVPGQCCEWMAKFDIGCQKALRPYTNSCSNCGGSGDKGNSPCQACDGTGLEGSTGGALQQPVYLIKLTFITDLESISTLASSFMSVDSSSFITSTGTSFETQWKGRYLVDFIKVVISVNSDTLNSLSKITGDVVCVNSNKQFLVSEDMYIYYYNYEPHALQTDLRAAFPFESF